MRISLIIRFYQSVSVDIERIKMVEGFSCPLFGQNFLWMLLLYKIGMEPERLLSTL